jgi:hemerythrin superfamily protein
LGTLSGRADRTKEKGTTMASSTKSRAVSTEKDAIALLKDDHKKVRELLGEMEETTEKAGAKRTRLLALIEQELTVHTKIEEEIFYPAFRDAARKKDDTKLYFEDLEEHHVVDLVLPELKGTRVDSEQFAAKAKVLKELVEHHADEEEAEMFPRARKLMDREELLRLGGEMAKAKESMARGIVGRLAGLVGV